MLLLLPASSPHVSLIDRSLSMAEDDLIHRHPQYSTASSDNMTPRQNGTNAKLNANFKKESRVKNAASSGRAAVCKVMLLDGEEFECHVDVSASRVPLFKVHILQSSQSSRRLFSFFFLLEERCVCMNLYHTHHYVV
jgi:hypothetical protein